MITTTMTSSISSNWWEATVDSQMGRIDMTVEISDVKHLQKVIKSLKSVAGVVDVERAADRRWRDRAARSAGIHGDLHHRNQIDFDPRVLWQPRRLDCGAGRGRRRE